MEDGGRPGFFARLFRRNEENAEEEIVSILNEGQDQGTIGENEVEMITNIFELDDTIASQIMTHRKNISAVDCTWTLEHALEYICSEGFSRFPVFDGNIDNIIGVLHIKDAVKFYLESSNREREVKDIKGLLQKPIFIPETSKINTVFGNMQSDKVHLAVVVDEYGQTSGIIAMEDILEEIVGNIFDEHDEVEINVTKSGEHIYEAKGLTPLSEIEDITGIKFADEDNDTLNGYLVSHLDRIPDDSVVGEEISIGDINYTILKVEDRTIALVRIELPEDQENIN